MSWSPLDESICFYAGSINTTTEHFAVCKADIDDDGTGSSQWVTVHTSDDDTTRPLIFSIVAMNDDEVVGTSQLFTDQTDDTSGVYTIFRANVTDGSIVWSKTSDSPGKYHYSFDHSYAWICVLILTNIESIFNRMSSDGTNYAHDNDIPMYLLDNATKMTTVVGAEGGIKILVFDPSDGSYIQGKGIIDDVKTTGSMYISETNQLDDNRLLSYFFYTDDEDVIFTYVVLVSDVIYLFFALFCDANL